MQSTYHRAIRLRQLWEEAVRVGRDWNLDEAIREVHSEPEPSSTEISRLERWAARR